MQLRSNRFLSALPLLLALLLPALAFGSAEWQGSMDSVVVDIAAPDTIVICRGDTVTLTQTNNVMDAGLTWRPAEGLLSGENNPTAEILPIVSRYYVVTVDDGMGSASDSVYIDVKQLVVPDLIADTLICQNSVVALVQQPVEDQRMTTYDWSPGTFLEDSTDVNVRYLAQFAADTVFTLISTSMDSLCADTQSVRIDVIPSRLQLAQEDTVFVCNTRGTLSLSAGGADGVTWFPTTGIVGPATGSNIQVEVLGDITYFATAEINGCPQIDSVAVRVDSLPADLTLTAQPEKDPYCPGDTVLLFGTVFDVEDYPLITHNWVVAPGAETPDDLYNMFVTVIDTTDYTRVTRNGACIDTAVIPINVIPPPILVFDPPNPVICPGEELQVTVTFDPAGPEGTLEWMDPVGGTLSCTDCLDPVVTTGESVTYEIEVTSVPGDCPSTEMYTVQTASDALPVLVTNPTICPGDAIDLVVSGIRDDFTYTLSGGNIMRMGTDFLVTPAETTTYTITTEGNCGTEEQTVTVEVLPDYSVTLEGPGTICRGDAATFVAEVDPDRDGSFSFSPAGGTQDGNTYTLSNLGDNVTVTATFLDARGCQNRTATATAMVQDLVFEPMIVARRPDGVALSDSARLLAGGSVVLEIANLPAGFDGMISWQGNGNPASAGGASITVDIPESGLASLSYRAVITSDAGCDTETGISLNVTQVPFAIPEIISANLDGTNDNFQVFFAQSVPVDNFTLVVYNRWGQEVFSSTDPEQGWDGTKDGSPQNLGTYLYLTKFVISGVEFEREGQFALVR